MQALRTIALLLVPAAAYLAWVLLRNRHLRRTGSSDLIDLRHGPWFWLFLAGVALSAAGLVASAFLDPGVPAASYHPQTAPDRDAPPGPVR